MSGPTKEFFTELAIEGLAILRDLAAAGLIVACGALIAGLKSGALQ